MPERTAARAHSRLALESEALLVAAIVGAGVALTFGLVVLVWRATVSDAMTVGAVGAGSALVSGIVVAVAAYVRSLHVPGREWMLRKAAWKVALDISVIAILHAAVAATLVVLLFALLFHGGLLRLRPFAAVGAVGISAGTSAYWIYLSTVSTSVRRAATLLMVFTVAILVLILTVPTAADDDPDGVGSVLAAGIVSFPRPLFDFSFIIAGAFTAAFAHYVAPTLEQLHGRGELKREWASAASIASLVFMGFLMVGVGVIPAAMNATLHGILVAGTASVFVFVLLTAPFALHGLPRRFFLVGWAHLTVIAAAIAMYLLRGGLTPDALALVMQVTVLGWVALLTCFADALAETPRGRHGDDSLYRRVSLHRSKHMPAAT